MYLFRKDLQEKEPVQVEIPHKRVMMSLNESTLNPLGLMKGPFLNNLSKIALNRYFSDITADLREKLCQYTGNEIGEDQILMGNGADQMLYYIFLAMRNSGDDFALSLAPSYFDYQSYCSAVGLGFKTHELDDDFDFSPDAYLEASKDRNCRLIIICYPNNPTGNLFDEEKIIEVVENTNLPVLIDETYYEFSNKTFIDRLKKYPNLIIVRSFSKSFSVAGLRFGYMVSTPENIREISKVFTAFNLSILIQTFALTLLEHRDKFLNHTKNVVKSRNKLFNRLSAIENVTVYSSDTNFLIFTIGEKTLELHDYLSAHDISVRSMHKLPLLANHLRVSVGTEGDNDLFVKLIEEFLNK